MKKEPRFHLGNLAKHQIDELEANEVLEDGWSRRRGVGENFEVLGRTSEGRHLALLIEEKPDHWWVFHGNKMTRTQRRRYYKK